MFIPKKLLTELKKKFPSVYAIYTPLSRGKIFIFYEGKENKIIKDEINRFFEGKIPSVKLCYFFTEKKITIGQVESKIYN